MIPVSRASLTEPRDFNRKCRRPGIKWLKAHPVSRRPRDFWTQFKPMLANGFGNLCAYCAMYEPVGTVDHFVSFKVDRTLAYEWDNYRYASAWLNSSKGTQTVLDPFAVRKGWFRILLPSLQLVVTDRVPPGLRDLAEGTVRLLHLAGDERIIRQRREWYRMYQEGELSLQGLRGKAPLIAEAIEAQA